jgi:hypothetical protein
MTVLAFPRDSMGFIVHCQLVVYHSKKNSKYFIQIRYAYIHI